MNRSLLAVLVPAIVLAGTVSLAGCGSGSNGSPGGGKPINVEASFYPLQWMAQQVGGSRVKVFSLTKPGAEPHDLELTPSDVAAVHDADVIVYLSGFQPAVDEAVTGSDATVFDAKDAANLDLTFTPIEEGKQHQSEAGATDPHFWLDPTRLANVADAFAATMAKQDPKSATIYKANAKALRTKLDDLDRAYKAGLADCANKDLVTSHNAFGYLAQRYGMKQIGITGLTPDDEPAAGQLADVTDFVEKNKVRTIYFETLVSPRVAQAVASEASVKTDVLDPIEGLNKTSQGHDYLGVMRANLRNLRAGQPCP